MRSISYGSVDKHATIRSRQLHVITLEYLSFFSFCSVFTCLPYFEGAHIWDQNLFKVAIQTLEKKCKNFWSCWFQTWHSISVVLSILVLRLHELIQCSCFVTYLENVFFVFFTKVPKYYGIKIYFLEISFWR